MFKILIAEDDYELRQLFQHVLVKNGYSVRGVSSGQEALDAINAIEGYATLLQEAGYSVPAEQETYINKILLNTRRLSSLVSNILLLSKVDNQSIHTNQTTFRLDEQIRQSIVLLEPEWS